MKELVNQINALDRDSSLAQAMGCARDMACHAKVLITPEQEELYGILRLMGKETGRFGFLAPETPKGPVWKLSDQQLLAGVFQLTGDVAKRNSFMDAYPNIFNNK